MVRVDNGFGRAVEGHGRCWEGKVLGKENKRRKRGRLNIKGMSQKLKLASGLNGLSVNFPRSSSHHHSLLSRNIRRDPS